jgi:hypothetical protein
MMRSGVNVLSQISAATLIERWSGNKQQEPDAAIDRETH